VISTRKPWLGWTLVIMSSLLFGLNASTTKAMVLAGFGPSFIVPFRSTATAVLALIVVLIVSPKALKITWRQLLPMAAFGVIGVAMMQWSYTNAVSRLPVGISLLIEYTSAIMLPLVNWLVFNKPAKRELWLGVAIAMVGLVLVSNFWNATLNSLGVLFAAMTAVFVTAYFLMAERIQLKRDLWSTLFYSMSFSAAFWWLVQPPKPTDIPDLNHVFNLGGNLTQTEVSGWVALAWMAVFGSFVPMAFNYLAVRHIDSNSMGLGSISEVVFAFIFGWLWLRESVNGIQLVGSLFVLAGMVVAQLATQRTMELTND
jgi:drug/metabolite transporter (DMT)-like permease